MVFNSTNMTGKDYTVSHPCGHEEYFPTKAGAMKAAKQHKASCGHVGSVYIDEHGGDDTEGMTGNYWKV